MLKEIDKKLAFTIILSLTVISILITALSYETLLCEEASQPIISFVKKITGLISGAVPKAELKDIKKFASEAEFKAYLVVVSESTGINYAGVKMREIGLENAPSATPMPTGMGAGGEPERVSETNVQVAGIDEPDIVKTDGKEIYFSPGYNWVYWREPIIWEESRIIPPYKEPGLKLIKAFPPADLKLDAEIDKRGDLLLAKNILLVFSDKAIYGYNVSNPKAPEKKWEVKWDNNTSIVGARLYKDKVYLVTANYINSVRPCPIVPLKIGDTPLEIECTDIYHPVLPVAADTMFVSMVLNPESGQVEKKVSFIGSISSSVVYMSGTAIYVTYRYEKDLVGFFGDFLKKKGKDLFPAEMIEKINKLNSYDISQNAKFTELFYLLEKYLYSLENDEQLRIENELTNRMKDYYKEYRRDLEKTGIVKIGLDGFDISASGSVPGYPLNQFSLDEYNGNLRMAITVGESWWGWGLIGGSAGESANDIYVLDKNLNIIGEIKDLGLTERIYSARFVEDKGYLVTFRQTDPFYVLDLSNPKKPEMKGELKIPGYSSYLHPISKDRILGIGQESWQVKISLFDVSSPANPSEKAKYILDESWSDILSTHHAFLLDSKHQIFFLPGSRGGYVFSYKNDELKLTKAVSGISARRAIYINDYLYIVGDDKIVVLNELDWQRVNELEL
ncbi:MAG: hypothetical protein COT34_02030 [Candidatus Nealsonbacteria bacterium CG08_land_8_20_14_0_20_43_11]|uniref:Copper amine oxidase-like N-terminal domain-containing protein n=1 Tax=Candidatus Nealsonbacteria bacterium CG08_land_8_20_14_0_20_43_11 TaxID=1974706 RepID=A0A2M6T094_9BACT|nr:MAG: hypothetical protein COT34_02030 [Candidatus Nealsonbacteria bacterium CG08_land_8_20_14_0_20_43_11]